MQNVKQREASLQADNQLLQQRLQSVEERCVRRASPFAGSAETTNEYTISLARVLNLGDRSLLAELHAQTLNFCLVSLLYVTVLH